MRKPVILILLVLLLVFSVHYATSEDLTGMTTDELLKLRSDINTELASRYKPPVLKDGVTIAEAFPDIVLAKYIRDQIGAFSTKDQVSQEQLNTITEVNLLSHDDGLTSLVGIGYLHNLRKMSLYWQDGLKEIPDEIGSLSMMEWLNVSKCSINALPDSICNLTNLSYLRLDGTTVSALPEDIGNLSSLDYLDISNTNITELPASIYNLKLETFLRDGLDLD